MSIFYYEPKIPMPYWVFFTNTKAKVFFRCEKTESYIFLFYPSILLIYLLVLKFRSYIIQKIWKVVFLNFHPLFWTVKKCLNWQRIHLESGGNRIKQELLHCLLSQQAFIVTTYSLTWASQTLIFELKEWGGEGI